ncbi:MAG: hypothetical protein KUL76_05030 [Kaistella sp.]|nr:hypothetical protein [Kaistella sp.]
MKTLSKTPLFTAVFLLFLGNLINAQFLDKLKKTVADKVERTIINKTAEKAAQKTDNTLDKVFDTNLNKNKQTQKVNPANVPSSFDFEYQYRLTFTTATSKTKLNMDYFLKPKATYMGVKMEQVKGQEVFMVMDGQTNINYMFIKAGENKMATASSINGDEIAGDTQDSNYEGYTFTDLPNRTFLGYNCKGKKMENSEYVFVLYFTDEAPVSFNDVFKMDTDRIPAAVKKQFSGGEKSTMMYMEMTDKLNKGKKDRSGTMECTLLQPQKFTFSTAGYRFM